MIERPILRPIEAFPAEYEGKALIALRDPQGYAEEMVLIPREVLSILEFFDGEHSVLDIQEAFMRQSGELLYSDLVRKLIHQLDSYHLLLSPSFEIYKSGIVEEFRESKIRCAFHAGAAYEDRPEDLRRQLDSLFSIPGGPGVPDPSKQEAALVGLVAPHIDLHRGGKGYAYAYKALVESEPADVYVILGVAHAGSEHLFSVTQKDFETPLGRTLTDRMFVKRLQEHTPDDLFADEISHKTEHSIEFQVIFLQHLLAGKKPFKIVPILVGSFHDLVQTGLPLEDFPRVRNFIQALSTTLEETRQTGRRVCVIASVDLSHVGQRFGDVEDLTPVFLDRVRQADQIFLQHVLRRDWSSLHRMICGEKDWRKVCGFPALYVFLQVLPECQSTLLDYEQWADPPGGCSVSFASMAFR